MTTEAVNPECPRCGSNKHVCLTTPDYGFGYGAEFSCFSAECSQSRSGEHRFAVNTPEAWAISDASRALSAANAQKYLRGEITRHPWYLIIQRMKKS